MSEATNVEQRASGARITPTAWICEKCGSTREQQIQPEGCGVCEALSARRSETPIQPGTGGDWQPLWATESLVDLVTEVMVRMGHDRRWALSRAPDHVEELTGGVWTGGQHD